MFLCQSVNDDGGGKKGKLEGGSPIPPGRFFLFAASLSLASRRRTLVRRKWCPPTNAHWLAGADIGGRRMETQRDVSSETADAAAACTSTGSCASDSAVPPSFLPLLGPFSLVAARPTVASGWPWRQVAVCQNGANRQEGKSCPPACCWTHRRLRSRRDVAGRTPRLRRPLI